MKITGELTADMITDFANTIEFLNSIDSSEVSIKGDIYLLTPEEFIEIINNHNLNKNYVNSEGSLKNSIVSKIWRVITAPSNQLAANSPITIQDWHDAVDEVKSNRVSVDKSYSDYMSPYDIISYYIMQHNAIVGKEDVGIAANGVKVFSALTDYYNNFFNKNFTNDADLIRRSDYLFNKNFSFTNSKGEIMNFNVNSIADILVDNNIREILTDVLGNFELNNSGAQLILSGFLSGATDNAKELLMAEVNATPDLASVVIYLTILGLDLKSVVEIMTSDVVNDIVKNKQNNIFIKEFENSMKSVFILLQSKYKGDKQKLSDLNTFIDLYNGAQELTALSGLLSINTRRKANTLEMYKYLSKLERIFDTANEKISKLKEVKLEEVTDEDIEKIAKSIINKSSILNLDLDLDYVKGVVEESMNLDVNYIDHDGSEVSKKVNLLKDGLDYRYYINDENYKNVAIEYYNLIKNTFNILHVVNIVPHFKAMIEGLVSSHKLLSKSSKKYNFTLGILKDVLNIGDSIISDFSKYTINEFTTSKASNYFDSVVIENWLKSKQELSFSLKSILDLTDTKEFRVYTSNSAKSEISDSGPNANVKTIYRDGFEPNTEIANDDFQITLDTPYNIANFKVLFEKVILPYLKNLSKSTDNEFVKHLRKETIKGPFNVNTTSIVSSYDLRNINDPMSLLKFQKLLNDFNRLDDSLGEFIQNTNNNVLKWKDLFFVYNLIVNNEKYGNKSLTPILQNYMRDSKSLGYDYIKYYSDVDKPNYKLFPGLISDNSISNEDNDDLRDSLVNNILYHIANKNGVLHIKDKKYNVTNSDFVLMSDVGITIDEEINSKNLRDIVKLIKENGYIINLKC